MSFARCYNCKSGEMSEWLKEHAWKVCIRERIEGSNPSLSTKLKLKVLFYIRFISMGRSVPHLVQHSIFVSVPFSGDGGLLDGDSHRFGACMAKGVYGQPTWSLGLAVERPFPVFAQGPQPDGFFRLVVFLVPVVPSASLGDADMGPSGGLVGDASEARRLHERFDQQGRDVIARGPVRNQLSAHDGQDVRGEVGDAYPGQDEEPGVVDDLGEIFLPQCRRPADEAVARRQFACRGGEPEQSQ